jgi:dienelactone hydrolase
MALSDYQVHEFSHAGYSYPVFRRGSGPAVVVIHEVPGLTPEVIAFADRVAEAGFSVYMPSLFGTPGKRFSMTYAGRQIARACIRKEFAVLEARGSSPVVDFLRGLCQAAHEETGGPVGAIGMCLTGNFALTLAVDDWLMAPVLSQPSLPFPVRSSLRRALHLSDADLERVRHRVTDQGLKVLGLRFTEDPACPGARFRRLEQEFGDGFEAIEIDSSRGNAAGIPRTAHSVVTKDLVDRAGHPTRQALDRVLAFFRERLQPA